MIWWRSIWLRVDQEDAEQADRRDGALGTSFATGTASLKVEPTEPEQCFTYSDLDGKRTDYTIRNEGDALNVTRLWVQSWILNSLTPYHNQTPDQILAAADAGKFRYLGLWCRMALEEAGLPAAEARGLQEQFAGHTTVTENLGTSEMGASPHHCGPIHHSTRPSWL